MSEFVDHIEIIKNGTFLASRPGYYFGYGLEAVPEVMDSLLDRSVTTELGVTAIGQQLLVQEIDQVPNEPVKAFGDKSPQEIIAEAWRKHTDAPFSSYALRPTDHRSSTVNGTLYEIDLADAMRLSKWNLVTHFKRDKETQQPRWPGWRFWDHAIELTDGRKVETLTIGPDQPVDRIVNGTEFDPYLNGQRTTFRVIQDFVDGLGEQ